MNLRPSGYEPDELPGCSTPRHEAYKEDESYSTLSALFKSGSDLLSHVLRRSTIGAAVLNGRVRDGIECFTRAITTKLKKSTHCERGFTAVFHKSLMTSSTESYQAFRAISTSQLNTLLRLHLWPIDVVVFHGPQGRPCFEGGFPLRCLQRLSFPHIATLLCRWHDNRSTSGASTPVLSY